MFTIRSIFYVFFLYFLSLLDILLPVKFLFSLFLVWNQLQFFVTLLTLLSTIFFRRLKSYMQLIINAWIWD